jgi:hypothetical protein
MHYERSVGYHKYTAEFYLHYLLLARAFGLPEASSIRDSVRAQTGAAGLLRRPDGTWPVIGDEDSGDTLLLAAVDPQDQGPLLAVSAGLFQDAELLALTSDAHRAAGWWLLDASEWQWVRDTARESLGSARRPGSRAGAIGDAALGGALPAAGYFIGARTIPIPRGGVSSMPALTEGTDGPRAHGPRSCRDCARIDARRRRSGMRRVHHCPCGSRSRQV